MVEENIVVIILKHVQKKKGCKKLHKKCYWKGAIITKIKREKCLWTNRGKNRKQVRCCVWFKKCIGKHCKSKNNKRCRWVDDYVDFNWFRNCKMERSW